MRPKVSTFAKLEPHFHIFLPTRFGLFAVVWKEKLGTLSVQQIYLPRERGELEKVLFSSFPQSQTRQHPQIQTLCADIQSSLEGTEVQFSLETMALERCPDFQRKVLLAEFSVPRGWVTTYGRIAHALGVNKAARAVGSALAHNPFPIVIPCHRAIQSNGKLGGYQGGLAMKRALLEQEGVEFFPGQDRVIMNRVR